ncbi:MipA/OmpV family protein [Dokdonella sp.]|uniref:MipA/OmpV family protein n=1 Tax=Dokdonella sp. TaxID=2291710 RepID=UPI003527F783
MKQFTVLLATSCLLANPLFAHAQEESVSAVAPTEVVDNPTTEVDAGGQPEFLKKVTPDGISLGVGMLVTKGILLGEDARIYVVPTVGYVGERVFITGISGGVHLVKHNGFALDALLSARLDGWDADDLSASELAEVGIDRDLLVNRKNELDAGFGASYSSSEWGKLSLTAKADVSNASDGYEIALLYQAAFDWWGGALIPSVGVSYWSNDLSDYYYGTLPQEVAAGVPSYQPGSAIVPNLGVTFLRTMPKNWLFFGGLQYQWLSDDILDSPLVDPSARNGLPSVFLGFSHSFGKIH